MQRPYGRLAGLATSGYAAYALLRPGHLADALEADPAECRGLDRLAMVYGVRDLSTSALLLASDPALGRAAMALRIASDLGDCAVLTATTSDPRVRRKVAAVTLGWAAVNAAAWWADERRR
jgi:hypothetical protein